MSRRLSADESSGATGGTLLAHNWPNAFAVASFTALVVAYFWLIDTFAVNTIWVDQWDDLALIQHAYSGHLTLSALWAQHTDNRILFPNLVMLLLAKATAFNVVDESFLSGCVLTLATIVLILGHRRRVHSLSWIFYLPVAILMLSFVQSGNTLWGFQFAWYLVLLSLCVSLVLCDAPRWSWLIAFGAVIAAVVGSYSSVQGLLIWISGLVILLLRRRPLSYILAWVIAATITTVIFFISFNTQEGANSDGYVLHHPIQGLKFFFFSVGNVTGAHGGYGSVVLGILIVLIGIALSLWTAIRPKPDDAAPLGVGLICFGLLFALFVTDGRATFGLNAGGASRYTTFDLLTLVGCYLVIVSRREIASTQRRNGRALWWVSAAIVVVAIALNLVVGTLNGLSDSRSWQKQQIQASVVIANIERAPDSMVERVLTVNPYYVSKTRELAAFAERNGLNLFANQDALTQYRREKLPYDPHSLVTSVLLPKNGAAVASSTLLLASASSDYGVAKVSFVVSGAAGYRSEISGRRSPYGWLASWNSAGLPEGKYKIASSAYDRDDHRATSNEVFVSISR